MAASEPEGRDSARPHAVAISLGGLKSALLIAAGLAIALYFFPLFRIVSLKTQTAAAATAAAAAPAAFDPVSTAAKFWNADLPAAIPQAVQLKVAEKAVEAYAQLAKTNNTMIVPGHMGEVAGLVGTAMALFKGGKASP